MASASVSLPGRSLAEELALDPKAQVEFLAGLTEAEAKALAYDWSFWARPKQLAPAGDDWWFWLILAGRGFGKSRSGAEWVLSVAEKSPGIRIALVGETAADVRDVMVEGPSGIIACSPPWNRPRYEPSKRRITWANGSVAITYSAETPDQLRGPEHSAAWCFIAGTMIATQAGDVPVESVRLGDQVLTRAGARTVTHAAVRLASTGRVTFSNGAELVGTADHPILTANGWTKLADLSVGDRVCAIVASNGADTAGTATVVAISNTAGHVDSVEQTETRCTEPSTGTTSETFRPGTMCTTGTRTSSTTTPRTSSACPTASTSVGTSLTTRSLGRTGRGCLSSNAPATTAVLSCSGAGAESLEAWCASRAPSAGLMRGERPCEPAGAAESASPASVVTTAVSVASTWEPAGLQLVHNLQVAETPEYFANGILVHNCDELAKWKKPDAWDQLLFGMRRPDQPPKVLVTTTPRPTPLIKALIKDPNTRVTRGSTYENQGNLAPAFLEKIRKKYEGTRLGRQELEAELLDDAPGALWQRECIDANRRSGFPTLVRVVVAIDPSVSSESETAETGIVAAGLGDDGHGYVLADGSLERPTPNEWGAAAVSLYNLHQADLIVGEVNNGGDLVAANVQSVQKNLPFKMVRASRGKAVRAEPVANLYAQGRIHHVGAFGRLEDEQCQWEPGVSAWSPNRVDALVWAITELMVGPEEAEVVAIGANDRIPGL